MDKKIEQVNLNFSYDNCSIVCKLRRSDKPLSSFVDVDEGTKLANTCFDFDFDGENKFYPFEFPSELKDLDFSILVITGASGAGKSVFSRYFGEEEVINWNNNKAIISNFETAADGANRLNSVGLCSIPSWCKPYKVLSVGESFRADLARRIKSNCVIDEFTSTVDRNVALSCSKSIGKYIRNNNLKRCVFVSCHKDFIDTLCPDYVIDLDDECLYDTRGLLRRKFELSIYERSDKREVWNVFKKHHYLSADLNLASRMYVAYLNNEMVAMCAVIPMPGAIHNAFRIHRLVVLPDYQGLGIGVKLLYEISKMYTIKGCKMYLRTTHSKLIKHCRHNTQSWKESMKKGDESDDECYTEEYKERRQTDCLWKMNLDRHPKSFLYVGDCNNAIINNNLVVSVKEVLEMDGNQLFGSPNIISKWGNELAGARVDRTQLEYNGK